MSIQTSRDATGAGLDTVSDRPVPSHHVAARVETAGIPHVQSVWPGSAAGHEPSGPNRKVVALVGLLLILAVGAGILNWWTSTGQSVAGDVPVSPGVDRQVDGLHLLNAYLVPGAIPGAFTVVADLVSSSGGADRLVSVSAGNGGATTVAPTAGTTPSGLPVGSGQLLRIGPEAGAQPLTVTGVTRSGGPGTFVRTTFNLARRGPISVLLPVWSSLSGPAGPS